MINLARGAAVELRGIVNPARLREVTLACLPFHRAAQEKEEVVLEGPLPPASCADEPSLGGILWACEKDYHQAPLWSLLPEGIVIGQWGNPNVTAALDGMGPVIPWSVLLRDGALRPASPLARLWAGVAVKAAYEKASCEIIP